MAIFEVILSCDCSDMDFFKLNNLDFDKREELKWAIDRGVEEAFEDVTGVVLTTLVDDLNLKR